MREKGKHRKTKKILIRVDKEEKLLAEKLSKAEGKNTSQFFRGLLKEHATRKLFTEVIKDTIRKEIRRKK